MPETKIQGTGPSNCSTDQTSLQPTWFLPGFFMPSPISAFSFAQPFTHAHTGNTHRGPKWSPSNDAHDSRADWGSGTGHPESLCVIQTQEVPISPIIRLMSLAGFLQFSVRDFVQWRREVIIESYRKWLPQRLPDGLFRVLRKHFQFPDA